MGVGTWFCDCSRSLALRALAYKSARACEVCAQEPCTDSWTAILACSASATPAAGSYAS
jgi:hypothetical protein